MRRFKHERKEDDREQPWQEKISPTPTQQRRIFEC
jgi:hypothetical protein